MISYTRTKLSCYTGYFVQAIINNLPPLLFVVFSEQYGIGFLKGNDELKDQVEASLLELYADGTVDEVAEKYGIDPTQICLEK